MEFHELSSDFYADNSHLVEVLDKDSAGNFKDKGRGYAVLLVEIKGYKFAIPLRSTMHIGHKFNFTTRIYKSGSGRKVRHGLDYSKAVIITSATHVNKDLFKLKLKSDYVKIDNKEAKIYSDFEKVLDKYILAVKNNDKNILNEFRFSTLQNYHLELGLITEEAS
ncbi:type III toxin-antitoxin system TenpIN family toxin [Rummeliibacillus suwonensis]|uniref:type III toxin-antitoxin system TenpIN family toxin n=1 Tax=Rummeliibacillus suwonensis TaxID=1306154 RepID=UPI002899933E|nr:hypothetical protein [Rummeliibacillus suwonensis]